MEYISREAVVEVIKNYGKGAVSDGMKALDPVDDIVLLAKAIDLIPSADVVEVAKCKAEIENYEQIAEHQQQISQDRYFEIDRLKKVLKAKSRELKNKIKTCDKLCEEKVMFPRKIKTSKAEAVKEFAELLLKKAERRNHKTEEYHYVLADDIVDLLKEMEGKEWIIR